MKTKTQTQGENLKIILPVRYITLIIKIRKRNNKIYSFFLGTTSPNPFDMSGLSPNLMSTTSASNTGTKPKKSVHSLLGEHSNLVNLDNLVTADNKKNSTQGMQFHLLLISRHTKKSYSCFEFRSLSFISKKFFIETSIKHLHKYLLFFMFCKKI